jgi:C4-dicarboxylate transporter, DctQ subunit
LRILAATDKVFSIICRYAAGFIMLIIMVLVFGEIVSRYIFGVSHEFVPAISSWAMVWMTYFMLGVILKTREHINVDILPARISPRYRAILLTFIDVVSLALAVLIFYGGLRYDLMIKQSNIYAVTVQFVPVWIVHICVPMGSFFLAFFACEHLVNDARLLARRGEERP